MTNETNYFAHSGKVPVTAILLMIIFGLIGALILSVIYGYAIAYIPLIYINFFITVGFGMLTGIAVGIGGKMGKARKPALYGLIGLIVGLFAVYASWIAWFYASSDQTLLILNPDELLTAINLVSITGAWNIFGWTPTGLSIYLIWAIEALIVIGGCTLVAYGYVQVQPFCEKCSQWVENAQTITGYQAIEDEKDFTRKLEEGQLDMVSSLQKAPDTSLKSTEIEINHCGSCDESNYLSLTTVNVSVDDKGKESKDSNKFICNLKISNGQHGEIADLC